MQVSDCKRYSSGCKMEGNGGLKNKAIVSTKHSLQVLGTYRDTIRGFHSKAYMCRI